MSDTDAIFRLLQREGSRGVHTLDLRREGFSGNPSQRKADIEKKYGVQIHAERERRGKRNGSRYRLVGVGGESGAARDVGAGALGHSLDSGESPETTDGSAPSLAGSSPAQVSGDSPTLFEVGQTSYERMRDAA